MVYMMDENHAEKPGCNHPQKTGIIKIDKPGYYEICRFCFQPMLVREFTTKELAETMGNGHYVPFEFYAPGDDYTP
jgi:hypothetical protein